MYKILGKVNTTTSDSFMAHIHAKLKLIHNIDIQDKGSGKVLVTPY